MKANKCKPVLNEINKAREAIGLKPITSIRSGNPNDPTKCPLTRSISHGIQVHEGFIEAAPEKARAIAKVWGKDVYKERKVDLPDILEVFRCGVDSARIIW